ncbi:MAG TPA: hypothetical protein VIL69_20015 [Roseomonas sp.]|jgi:hypothetical protein
MQGVPHCFTFRFAPAAIAQRGAIDLVDGRDILLHVKPLADRLCIVLNSYFDGRWASEHRIPLPPEAFQLPLSCSLSVWKAGLLVTINGEAAVEYPIDPERLGRAELNLSPHVELLGAEASPPSLALEGEILVADIAHVRARLRFLDPRQMAPARLGDATLLLCIDGRPSRTRRLLPPPGQPLTQTTEIHFELDAEVFVTEGMEAELLIEGPEGRRSLARRPITSHFVGGVEHCSETMVSGFVFNPELPGRAVMLDIFVGDRFEGTTCANMQRPDLKDAGLAYAACGFRFRFRQPLLIMPGTEIVVFVRVRDTDIDISHSAWQLSRRVTRDEVEGQKRQALQVVSSVVKVLR